MAIKRHSHWSVVARIDIMLCALFAVSQLSRITHLGGRLHVLIRFLITTFAHFWRWKLRRFHHFLITFHSNFCGILCPLCRALQAFIIWSAAFGNLQMTGSLCHNLIWLNIDDAEAYTTTQQTYLLNCPIVTTRRIFLLRNHDDGNFSDDAGWKQNSFKHDNFRVWTYDPLLSKH